MSEILELMKLKKIDEMNEMKLFHQLLNNQRFQKMLELKMDN